MSEIEGGLDMESIDIESISLRVMLFIDTKS